MLALAIQVMLDTAPALVLDKEYPHPSVERLNSMGILSRYILENSADMYYERLFDDREGDWHISSSKAEDETLTYTNPLSSSFQELIYGPDSP